MYHANHLAAVLRAASVGRDNAVFAETAGRSMTYGELFAAAERMASVLVAAGVKPGMRVAVQVERSLQAVQLYLATLIAGGVFVPFNPAYTESEMAYFIGDCEPVVLVCDPVKRKSLTSAAKHVGASFTLSAAGDGTIVDAMQGAKSFTPCPRNADDLAAILYTSGTTGRAKGAMLSHGNLAANARALTDCWQMSAADKLIHALPLFHMHGLFVAVHTALIAGARLHFLPKFDAGAIVAAMQHATLLMGVPAFYARLLDHPGLNRQAAAGMRMFISGSAPLSAQTQTGWRDKTGRTILERYGMTETGINTATAYPGDGDDDTHRAGNVGPPLPGIALRIADADGNELPQGETGVIEVRGANVFCGYWRMPEKTRAAMRADGSFITGDLGEINEHGEVVLHGRTGDLIISGGYNIYPAEIERLLDAIPGVKESAVIGLPDPGLGECAAAVVVCSPAVTEQKILAALQPNLARFKQPRIFFFTAELPRNAMGKIQKNSLRERYGKNFS